MILRKFFSQDYKMIIANLRESCMYTGEKKGRSIWVEKWVCF